jgi:cytidine deaminase
MKRVSSTDLSPDQAELLDAARLAASTAYAPYSRFVVGAAVRSSDGRLFTGGNVENASFGLTICAERVAVGTAVAAGIRSIVAVGVYTPTPEPTAPCGACRQVLNEFGPGMQVSSGCDSDSVLVASLADLLPASFGPDNLQQ